MSTTSSNSSRSLVLLQNIKIALLVTVSVTCVVLLTVGSKKAGLPNPYPWPATRPASKFSHQAQPDVLRQGPAVLKACNLSHIKVLGKPLDRCATSEAVKLAEEEDIYVSIKSASVNHERRMLPDILTWLQTLQPHQVKEFNIIVTVSPATPPIFNTKELFC